MVAESGRIGNHFMGWPVCLSRELESKILGSWPFVRSINGSLACNKLTGWNQKATSSVPRLARTAPPYPSTARQTCSTLSPLLSPWRLGFPSARSSSEVLAGHAWVRHINHYRRHNLYQVLYALLSVLYWILGKGVVCRVSPLGKNKHTIIRRFA